jgi:hypothetical protein
MAWLYKLRRADAVRIARRDEPRSHAGVSSNFVHAATTGKDHNTNFTQFEASDLDDHARGSSAYLNARDERDVDCMQPLRVGD